MPRDYAGVILSAFFRGLSLLAKATERFIEYDCQYRRSPDSENQGADVS
jgi:hypothetical protein